MPSIPMHLTVQDMVMGDAEVHLMIVGRLFLTHHSLSMPVDDHSFDWIKVFVEKKEKISEFVRNMKKASATVYLLLLVYE